MRRLFSVLLLAPAIASAVGAPDAGDPADAPGDEEDGGTADGDAGEETVLLGVGSSSTSKDDYPRTGEVTDGRWYFEPENGDDGNTGESPGEAFKTLAKEWLAREITYYRL